MLIPVEHAAGLLMVLASLVTAEPTLPDKRVDASELLRSFQRRGKVMRHMAESRKRNFWPLRQRSRRSQIGLQVDKNQTFVLEKTPPRLIHPSKFEYTDGNTTRFVEDTDFANSAVPFVDSQDGEAFFRSGRTSKSGNRFRPVNPALDHDNDEPDQDVLEFRIHNLAAISEQVDQQAVSMQTGYFSSDNGALRVLPAGKIAQRDLATQHFFEAATKQDGGDNVKITPTWQGQPSKFKPSQPYQPSMNSTTASTGYADVISKSLWFYQVQRSGLLTKGPRPITWRNDSGLQDGLDNGIDLTGGYYDAGDYLKFTFPLSSALTQLAWAGTDHWRGIFQSGNLGYWDETLRWGLDWLIKAHHTPDTLFVQVGDGKIDNDYWGPDTTIPTPRPSFSINRDSPGTDVAAGTAGAFAAGAIFYAATVGDQKYAEVLLSHALSLYYYAESAPRALYQNSVPAVKEWYASSDYSDELTLTGLLLYRATSNSYFLKRAETYFKKYKVGENRDPTDWDSKHGLSMLLGAQLVQQNNAKSKVDWVGNLTSYLEETAVKQAKTPGGLLYWPGSSDENSIPSSMGITWVMAEYAKLFPSNPSTQSFRDLADSQIDYVFGKNPRGSPYVVGISDKSPKNPQSAMASGGNDVGNIDKSPEKMLRTLYGGLVGGPAKDDSFQDRRSNYKQSECALDYNAPLTAIMALELERGKIPYFLR